MRDSVESVSNLPLVAILATGGTIANTPSGRLHAGEVADAIPALKKVARLEVEELIRVASSAIGHEHWLPLARRVNEILSQPRVKGVVVTHGSNTVEETAYFLGLTVKSDKPVVLTAAQRQFTTLSSDSPKNQFGHAPNCWDRRTQLVLSGTRDPGSANTSTSFHPAASRLLRVRWSVGVPLGAVVTPTAQVIPLLP